MEKICVAVRMRPSNENSNNGTYWKIEDNRRISLHKSLSTPIPINPLSYSFDHVFDRECSNGMVYELLTKNIIEAAVQGFNGTAFAYGQTSSGKTFTMNGSEDDPGIIHRAVKDIFTNIEMVSDREFLVRVSYMEIYNEEINDLFTIDNQKLQIHESLERGIFVAGLREEIVNSAEQVHQLLQAGEVNRHFGETNMNVRSSRSHTIFRMVIESKGKDTGGGDNFCPDDAIRVSVLNLVDLAGSERIAKTGADGVRLKEGKHINKSLMILGNVINKLSEGSKQRGHIPYRDSKLTRILQPALGGNAKTSIICTLAPEEVHVEETKGTLQFASRAKKITNCVQLNEILTDAALLKRQKLEIEDLREKLQGSRADVLEQEVLKLRNDMLKYELEREKLAMELEEERRSQKERDQCIKEQQMQIENLNSLVTSSDVDRISNQSIQGTNSNSHSVHQEDAFKTPAFKTGTSAFVVKRSNYSLQPDFSPFPIALNDVADEDTWLEMNKGYKADLEMLHMTPVRKVQSFPSGDISACTIDNYKQEVEDLKKQLELSLAERDELKRDHAEQVLINQRLIEDISVLQQEARIIQEVPQQLVQSVENCKAMYTDVFSNLQSYIADEESPVSKLISSANELGKSLFSTLEIHLSTLINQKVTQSVDTASTQQWCNMLEEKLKETVSSLVLPKTPIDGDELSGNLSCYRNKGYTLEAEISCLKEKLGNDLVAITERYQSLEKNLDYSNNLLEVSKENYNSLEKEFKLLKEEKDFLLQTVSSTSQRVDQLMGQKENVLLDLKSEVQRRKDLEDEIKQFGIAFASRQKSLMSFQSEFKSKIENLKAQHPVALPKSLGY